VLLDVGSWAAYSAKVPDPNPSPTPRAAPRVTLGVGWQEQSINDDPALAEQYWEQVPVTLVDGRQHDYWRVDEARLRAALLA
jgi:hypothetical protein